MKGLKYVTLLIFIMAFATFSIDMAGAAVNVYINATMPYDILYSGEMSSATVTIKNNENFPIRVYSVGVHYEWMPENVFTSMDFGGGYVQVESNGMATLGQLLIHCDDNASIGYHSFYYKVQLEWYNSYTGAWLNETVTQPGTIYVESPQKPYALQELQFANRTVSDAKNANFSSRRAVQDLQYAIDSLNDGWSAYSQNDYARAINCSHAAIDFISDAKIAERGYQENASEVEKIVMRVSDKLSSLNSTDDPGIRSAMGEAQEYLNKTRQCMDAEDFAAAMKYANLADESAENALKLQFYSSLKASEREEAKKKADAAMDSARTSLDSALNMTGESSRSILDDAKEKLGDAAVLFSQGDYDNATIAANVAASLVAQANAEEASYRMLLARNKIASAGDLKSQEAKALLDEAKAEYNQSEYDYGGGRIAEAAGHAASSMRLIDDAMLAERKWRDENPIYAAAPGFEALAAIAAMGAAWVLCRKC
jgi:hypothetical protein